MGIVVYGVAGELSMISEKELAHVLERPGYSVVGGDSQSPKRDLSGLLPAGSKLEVRFIQLWQWLDGPALEREFQFCPNRKWRADFAHIPSRLLIEIEGHGHAKSNRYNGDVEKYNAANLLGFRVYRLTGDMINVVELQKIIDFVRQKEQG